MSLADFVAKAGGAAADAAPAANALGALGGDGDGLGGMLGNLGEMRQALDEVYALLNHPVLQSFGINLMPAPQQQNGQAGLPQLGAGPQQAPMPAPPEQQPHQAPQTPQPGGVPPMAMGLMQHADEFIQIMQRVMAHLPMDDPDQLLNLKLREVARLMHQESGDGPLGEFIREGFPMLGIDPAALVEHDPDVDGTDEVPP